MDVKALAKSKRAHSIHHSKKNQPKRTAKAPAATAAPAAGALKQSGKQVEEKPQKSRGSKALPSNWDRYDEEGGSGSEETSQGNVNMATDVVFPKSKGMDYAHLVSEAKDRSQVTYAAQEFPSFDDTLDDLNLGAGPLLTARGQSILSWLQDDSFELDDKATATGKYEVPFLSLDLAALAEQLAKASLSERLFVESDLLPPEIYPDLYPHISDKLNQDQATTSAVDPIVVEAASTSSNSIQLNDVAAVDNSSHQSHGVASSNTVATYVSSSSDGGLESVHRVKDDFLKFAESDLISFPDSTPKKDTGSVAERPPRFAAAAAEAELDTLLDSFAETKLFESTTGKEELEDTLSTIKISQLMKKESDDMKSTIPSVSLDDTIDELLKETSNVTDANDGSISHKGKAALHDIPSASDPVSKSKLLDDFDSWLDTI